MDIIQCDKFIISTNGGNGSSNHPDRTTIAHILCHTKRDMDTKVHLYFNYKLELIETNSILFLMKANVKNGILKYMIISKNYESDKSKHKSPKKANS